MPVVLLLGASGLLGSHLAARLPALCSTVAPRPRHDEPHTRSAMTWLTTRLEATDDRSVEATLDEAAADVVVNAIGSRSGDRRSLDQVNARFPRRLAAMVGARGGRVIHISTDGVFSGIRGDYTEADAPDPHDDYGRAKLAGELPAPHLTIRTSFFGRSPRGAGLVEWLLTQRGRTVEGYTDYRFTGIAAPLLADLVAAVIASGSLEGVFHVGGDPITKFDVLTALVEQFQIDDVTVVPARRGPVDRTLNTTRFFAAIGGRRPSLADSLAALGAGTAVRLPVGDSR